MSDHQVSYDRVLRLLQDLASLVPDERRRDFQNVVGPFLVEHDPDEKARALIAFDLSQDRALSPTPIDETENERRLRLNQEVIARHDLAEAAGMIPRRLRYTAWQQRVAARSNIAGLAREVRHERGDW